MSKSPTCVVQDGCIARVHCRDLGYCKEHYKAETETTAPLKTLDDMPGGCCNRPNDCWHSDVDCGWREHVATLPDIDPYEPAIGDAEIATGAAAILTEAAGIVAGARNTTHGEKERSFQVIADLWNAYLLGRKTQGPITPFDVAQFMVLLKIGRSIQGKPARDHFVDAAGYSGIAGELAA